MWKSKIKSGIYIIGMIAGLVLIGTLFTLPQTLTSISASTVMTMENPCGGQAYGSMASMNSMMDMSSTGLSPIIQNKSTADYKLVVQLGPPETMLAMCQVTDSTTSGEVMVSGQMTDDMRMSMNTTSYHLELHVYDINTGATVALPVHEITITVTNSSGTTSSVPIAEMFGVHGGLTDLHYGNNIRLASGSYTIGVSVAGEKASFPTTISSVA